MTAEEMDAIDAAHAKVGGTHYQLLGVAPGCTRAEVRAAYFDAMKRFHPEVYWGRDLMLYAPRVEAIYQAFTLAFEVLCDPRRREAYDEELQPRSAPAEAKPPRNTGILRSPVADPASAAAPVARAPTPPQPTSALPPPASPPVTPKAPTPPGAWPSRRASPERPVETVPKEITQASLRRAHAEHALRQRRDRATALRDQGREATTRGDAAGALLLLRQALSLVPDDEALQAEVASLESARSSATYDRYATAAKIHERDKRWDAAAAAWMKALGERPKDFAANMGVARASCEALLDMSTAADHARRATQIDPRSADAHALLGRVFFLAGRLASARAAVAAALKVDSRHEEARELARKVKLET